MVNRGTVFAHRALPGRAGIGMSLILAGVVIFGAAIIPMLVTRLVRANEGYEARDETGSGTT
jgi:hypothetical protein